MNLIPIATSRQEADLRNALQSALLESVLCHDKADDDPERIEAVELYLRAHWLYLRAHDLPIASCCELGDVCCELGDVLAEIAAKLGLPEADPKAMALFTRCASCTNERGSHAVDAPHGIEGECAGWVAP